ncbi:hypothetical protein FZEAL_5830 [Fusarium zealandicum]|uniref:NACHT domain-containing protein n=1 Tax=Fusarium zealandicum TaxID=1053134 RepID=A0A8H4UIY1_9HYPO|nr:hypothetical protein FZEAL_5830 [Fusarium zealandicum]
MSSMSATLHDISTSKAPGSEMSEKDQCLKDLFIADPVSDRESIITNKAAKTAGTCEWILTKSEYKTWEQSYTSLLWISGSPGKGKTFMSIFLTQHLERSAMGQGVLVAYFFCDSMDKRRSTATSVLRGLMFQLIQQSRSLIDQVLTKWKLLRDKLFEDDSFEDLWLVFMSMLQNLYKHELFLVLDGIDECEDESLVVLLRKITSIYSGSGQSTHLKIVVLSRPHPACIRESLCGFPHLQLDGKSDIHVSRDVETFISDRVSHIAKSKNIEGSVLAEHIKANFYERSEHTFLWVSFMSRDIQNTSLAEMEEALERLPRGIAGIYERILAGILPSNVEMVSRILELVAVALFPLTVDMVTELLNINPTRYLSAAEVFRSYINSCGNLLEVRRFDVVTENPMEQARYLVDTVQLVHYSAKEFLLKTCQKESARQKQLRIREKEGHARIAVFLIHHLRKSLETSQIKTLSSTSTNDADLGTVPYRIKVYERHSWLSHMKLAGEEAVSAFIRNKGLFGRDSALSGSFWKHVAPEELESYEPPPLVHFCCLTGMTRLVEHLLNLEQHGAAVNSEWPQPKWPATPLGLACMSNRKDIVALLLHHGADPALRDSDGGCCIHWLRHTPATAEACPVLDVISSFENGHRFLQEEARLNQQPTVGLLHLAAASGNRDLCKYLIACRHFDVDSVTKNGYTPLFAAIEHGHLDIARQLVKVWHAKTDNHDMLLRAACLAKQPELSLPFVKELGIDLKLAGKRGSIDMIGEMDNSPKLLQQLMLLGAEPNDCDEQGSNWLHFLALGKHQGAPSALTPDNLEVLLGDGRVNINQPWRSLFTPLLKRMRYRKYIYTHC